MSDRISSMHDENKAREKEAQTEGDEGATLTHELEKLLVAVRPRLARLAYTHGVVYSLFGRRGLPNRL